MTSEEFKAARKALHFSQAHLAEKLGLSRVFVGLMERDQAPIASRTALAIQTILKSELSNGVQYEPIRRLVEGALSKAGLEFQRDAKIDDVLCDYIVPSMGVVIQVDADRNDNSQSCLKKLSNVIIIQGKSSAILFSETIGRFYSRDKLL